MGIKPENSSDLQCAFLPFLISLIPKLLLTVVSYQYITDNIIHNLNHLCQLQSHLGQP